MKNWKHKIKCFFGFHELKIKQVLTDISIQLECVHCKNLFWYNDTFKGYVKWDKTVDQAFTKLTALGYATYNKNKRS